MSTMIRFIESYDIRLSVLSKIPHIPNVILSLTAKSNYSHINYTVTPERKKISR